MEQRRHWRALGWTRTQWDFVDSSEKMPNSTWSSDWCDLTEEQKEAERALGFTADSWEASDWPLPRKILWEDLAEEAQNHLWTLGENEWTWEDNADSGLVGAGLGGDGRMWDDLDDDEQRAASALGFSRAIWNAEDGNACFLASWSATDVVEFLRGVVEVSWWWRGV